MLNKFAEELKEARIKSEASIQQIASKTRIDLKFLENIENGNFSFLPDLYIKAFIREYAKFVGLDDQITLKKFEAARHGKQYDELGNTEEEVKKTKPEKEEPSPKSRETLKKVPTFEAYNSSSSESEGSSKVDKKKMTMIGAAGGAVVLLIIIYFAFFNNSSEIVVPEKPYSEVVQDNQPRYVQDAPNKQTQEITNTTAGDSLSLLVQTDDSSWIKVLLDSTRVVEYTLLPHTEKDIKALRSYKMIVGNASAIQFKLNNKLLKFTGNKHEVKYVSIDSTGLKYLSAPLNF